MTKHNTGARERSRPKTIDYSVDNLKAFPSLDYNSDLEPVQSVIHCMIKPGRVVRCFRCFACEGVFPIRKMSSCLVFCRKCFRQARAKGRIATANQIDRTFNNILKFIFPRLGVE